MIVVPLPIETERLLVRSFVPDADSRPMLSVYCDPDVMRFIPGGALADIDAVQVTLTTHARTHESRGYSSWALVERESRRVIGDVGFSVFEPTGDIELGYTLSRDCWGRGYATEAAAACLAAGLAHLATPRIIAVIDSDNEASMRVAARIGMARVDEIEAYGRPHVLFAARR